MSSCPICHSEKNTYYLSLANYSYRECLHCHLIFLDYPDIPSLLKNTYNRTYIEKRGHADLHSPLFQAKIRTSHFYLSLLEKHAAKGKLLEVGCSTGITLKTAKNRGWEVYGVEPNDSAASIAQTLLDKKAIKIGQLSDTMFPDEFFCATILFDVLEHIYNPLEFFEILQRKMKTNGFLLLMTPNINSLSAKILKRRWFHWFSEHVCLYSPQSLKFLLDKFHFKIVRMGWALKFTNMEMIRFHFECHPHILFSSCVKSVLKRLSFMDHLIFPLNIGEIYVLAQKQC